MTAEYRTYIRGIWQRDGAVPLAIQAVQPQPISVFQAQQAEIVMDLYDELGAPVDLHDALWANTLTVKRQANNAPAVLTLTGMLADTPPNRVVFTALADELVNLPFGRYVYNVLSSRGDSVLRVTVPLSLFHVTPTVS